MIKADVPQDVTEYKEQIVLGMNLRQIICVLLILILSILTFLLLSDYITTDILVYIVLLEVAPLAAVGFLRYNGMGIEKIAVKVKDFYLGKQKRKMRYLPKETEIHDLIRSINLQSETKERTAEIKALKKKNKSIRKNKLSETKSVRSAGSGKKRRKQKVR